MKCTSATYTVRKTLAQYEHEELTATMVAEEGEEISGEAMLAEARKVCVSNSTEYLKKMRLKNKKGEQ